ncbi:DUF1636 family protein [Phreatobacter sp.]|uniref:DUF1636 family protein n=1 Tax=Phreatobacter sp. TaxID=1966341 RepID=UPI003F6FF9E1
MIPPAPVAQADAPPVDLNSPRPAQAVVTVCTACRPEGVPKQDAPGRSFHALVQRELGDIAACTVRPSECLSVCKRPCTVAVSHPDGYTYLFGDLDGEEAARALADFARLYVEAPHGFVPWRDRPEVLRRAIVARVPPAGWSPEDGGTP